jgi:preprotein translocase subunit SecD
VRGPQLIGNGDVDAAVVLAPDPHGAPDAPVRVTVSLEADGAKRFEAFTAEHVRRRLAILVDGLVMSAPVIVDRIPGGNVSIAMGAGDPEQERAEAEALAAALRAP